MKKIISVLLVFCMVFGFVACGESSETAESSANDKHTIGVLIYNIADEEVIAFREYLEKYIASVFPDVEFLYSDNITNEEEELAYIQNAADAGVEGIMSFLSYNLPSEVQLCEENGIYYMLASGSVAEEQFKEVEDNEYFLGVVGPGDEIEYQAGVDMANYFVETYEGDRYFLLSGGGFMGNEMHRLRTVGVLDALQEAYGVTFDQSSEELALSAETVQVQAGDLEVCICPGYISREEYRQAAIEAATEFPCDLFLAVLGLQDVGSALGEAGGSLGMVDCYSTENLQLFSNDSLSYVTGKYSSIIGPSFAAMYNAVTGYAQDFREADGKAFQIIQGFWTSDSLDDYTEKYSFSSSLELNAYNYEDLEKVCKVYNADATLEDLKALAGAYSFEEAKARRDVE